MNAGTAPAGTLPTGIHWHGNGWYAPRTVRGVQVYYYLGTSGRFSVESARVVAQEFSLGEPLQFTSKEGFTYVY